MSKGKILIVVVAALVVLVCAGLLLCKLFGGTHAPNGPDADDAAQLIACRYHRGGGMDGGYVNAELATADGKTTLSIESLAYNGADVEKKTFENQEALLQEINALITKKDAKRMQNAPASKHIAYDAPSSSLSFTFSNGEKPYGESFNAYFNNRQTDKDFELMNRIAKLMKAE